VRLDLDAGHFREDMTFLRMFLVEPGTVPDIPDAVEVGPRTVVILKDTNPWIGIAAFQQMDNSVPASSSLTATPTTPGTY
jgi:hypothetical protein